MSGIRAISQTVRFYWKCARWAASGTLERANAWYWLVGVPAIALIGLLTGRGKMTVPDTTVPFLSFMALTIVVSWIIFFAIRFVARQPISTGNCATI